MDKFRPGETVYGRVDGKPLAMVVKAKTDKSLPPISTGPAYLCAPIGWRPGLMVQVDEDRLSKPMDYAKWPMRVTLDGILPAMFLDDRAVFAMAPPDIHYHVTLSQCDAVPGHGPYAYVHAGYVKWPELGQNTN